jgi:outer membrane protein TolC
MFAIEARRAADAARALVSQYAGMPVQTRPLPPAPADPPAASEAAPVHPALAERDAAIREATERLTIARRSADPEVALQGTVYGRGTGVLDDNTSGSGADGFGLDEGNWAAGVTVTVPVMEWANRKAREAAQAARVKAAEARRDETSRDLARRQAVAAQAVIAARAIAQQVPLVVEAARSAHAQATARYQAGLSSLTDVADAQRRLAQAELDAALADLTVWRARLQAAALAADSADTFLRALPVVP